MTYSFNTANVSNKNEKVYDEQAISLAQEQKGQSEDIIRLLTGYITFMNDISSCRLDKLPLGSLIRQLDYVHKNRGLSYEALKGQIEDFYKVFSVKSFESIMAKSSPENRFKIWLNSQSKDIDYTAAFQQGLKIVKNPITASTLLNEWLQEQIAG